MSPRIFIGAVLIALVFFGIGEKISAENLPEVTVRRILDNGWFELNDGRVLQLLGVDLPSLYDESHALACEARKVSHFLRFTVLNKKITIIPERHDSGKINLSAHILFPDGESLAKSLIQLGFGFFENNFFDQIDLREQYISAEKLNKKNSKRKCSDRYIYAQLRNLKKQKTPPEVVVETVKNVFPNYKIETSDGQKFQIAGLQKIPDAIKLRRDGQCFTRLSDQFLAELLVGERVILRTLDAHSDLEFRLARVSLPRLRDSFSGELDVSEYLVRSGFAKADILATSDKKIRSLPAVGVGKFATAQRFAYQHGAGAWGKCFSDIAAVSGGGRIIPRENSAENCPIKGNISGTKSAPIKKYHTAESPWYKRVKAEACFLSESEAISAGFVKVK